MKAHSAFSLVEVVLSLGIATFCLLILLGMLPIGLNSSQSSREETAALNIASRISADLQSLPKGKTASNDHWNMDGLTVPEAGDSPQNQTIYYSDTLPNFQNTRDNTTRYRITAKLTPPTNVSGGTQHTASYIHLLVSWPPQLDPAIARPAGSIATIVALDRN
jgi:uncharacterized protein (TIGR02598 family)